MRVGAILFLVEIFAAPAAHAATLGDAKSAYSRNQVSEAERIYAAIRADAGASAVDRAEAERELARIAWLIDGDPKRALSHLEAARVIGDKPCGTAALKARVRREAKQSSALIGEGDALLAECPEPRSQDVIRTHVIGALLDQVATNPHDRPGLISKARSEAARFTLDADVNAARARLELGLVSGDSAAAIAAWKDYFWLDAEDAPQALEKIGATAIFERGLRADAGLGDRLKLAELLMRTGFAIQSRRFAELHQLSGQARGNPILARLQAYWTVRDRVEAAFLKANRRMARGGKVPAILKAVAKDLDKVVAESATTLLAGANSSGETEQILKASYGMVGTGRGETSGYPSVHMGHIVEDREMTVSQYGRSAKIHYMSVDNMLANGFESWLWDGGPMVGGWQADGVIVQVRPAYVKSPLTSYAQTQDTVARKELIGRQAQRSRDDLAKLKSRPVATLEGLGDRLQFQLNDQIMAVARTRANDEAGIRRAFLAEFTRANFDQSIEKHEGRHAIDETLGLSGKAEQPVLEYQAKLSELVLTTYPRMALDNMNLNLEGNGPHDKAGHKVFDEFRKWIEAHSDQVMGYDPALPALAQLDKLSDDQIREIARSLDPLANGKPSPLKL